jgi:carbon starvation protein
MFIMLAVTFTALILTIRAKGGLLFSGGFVFSRDFLQLAFAVLLLALGVMVAAQGVARRTEKEAK